MDYYRFAALTTLDGLMMIFGLAIPFLVAGGLAVYYLRNRRQQKHDQPIWYAVYFIVLAAALYYITFIY